MKIRSAYHNYYTFLTQINCRLGAVLLIIKVSEDLLEEGMGEKNEFRGLKIVELER